MLNVQQLAIKHFIEQIKSSYTESYGQWSPEYAGIVAWSAHLALENIANTDALYHNLEHTLMVAQVGKEILKGKHLLEGGVAPKDWLHVMIALLCHDIGYVYGVCREDRNGKFSTGIHGETQELPEDGTDVALAPYHVDRGIRFIFERFSGNQFIDPEIIAANIERTRFPVPDTPNAAVTDDYPGLVRAADFIGQLGDPHYLRKIPALFYEFEETGANAHTGYKNPRDMRRHYAKFYWKVVSPYIRDGLRLLKVTIEGKQWIANLHSQVFTVEHEEALA